MDKRMGRSGRKVTVSFVIRDEEEKLNRSGINALQIDAPGNRLYTAGRDSIVRCWDISSYGLEEKPYIHSMEHHTDWVNDIVLCKDGKTMMSASSDTTLKMWDCQRGLCLSTLRTHKDYVKALAYAPDVDKVVSGGLDRQIYLWDITTLTSLTATNNTITTSSLLGHKSSIYSLAANASGSLVISGSTEKSLRVWDPRKLTKITKLKGHSENIRAIVIKKDGSECLSASSDGTVRLWSIGQQRCIDTFRMHSSGVWTLAVDEDFTKFYSSGKDGCVFVTEIQSQESTLLCCEETSVLNLCLDPTDNYHSIWVATSNTHVNKWPTELAPVEPTDEEEQDDDEGSPLYSTPVDSIPGGDCVRSFKVLPDKRHILTADCDDKITLWDVFTASKVEELGNVDMEEEEKKWQQLHFIPNWFSVDVKTGMLMIRLEESEFGSAWVLGDKSGLPDADGDIKVNYGALMLRALFEHWPQANTSGDEKESGSLSQLQERKFFSVREHTPIIIAEAGDCGCTLTRFLCRDTANAHESRQIATHMPPWVEEIVSKKQLPHHSKMSFLLVPYSEGKKTQVHSEMEKLSAPDLIVISKVADYIQSKMEGKNPVEVLCMDQVLDLLLDIRTVKHTIWKGVGDMKLYYREIEQSNTDDEPKTPPAVNSN